MYGVIFVELKNYITEELGRDAWKGILNELQIGQRIYLATENYPDEEILSILSKAAEMTGEKVHGILEDFGEYIVPDLIGSYRSVIKPEWKTMDLLENTQKTIHKTVRARNPAADPPELVCNRMSPEEVIVLYRSPRRMCSLAKGLARGVAGYYNEKVRIVENRCMLRGDRECEISIRLIG